MQTKIKFYTAVNVSHTSVLYGAVFDDTCVEAVYPLDEKIDGPAVALMLHKAVVKKCLLSLFSEPTQEYNRVVCGIAEAVGLRSRLKWENVDDITSIDDFHAKMLSSYRA